MNSVSLEAFIRQALKTSLHWLSTKSKRLLAKTKTHVQCSSIIKTHGPKWSALFVTLRPTHSTGLHFYPSVSSYLYWL